MIRNYRNQPVGISSVTTFAPPMVTEVVKTNGGIVPPPPPQSSINPSYPHRQQYLMIETVHKANSLKGLLSFFLA